MRNTKSKPNLPELCAAVRRVRQAANLSQERFAQQVGIATQTISRFELGRQVPRDINVLARLRDAAADAGLTADQTLFNETMNALPESAVLSPYRPRVSMMQTQSPHEWRLVQAARVAARYFPDLARKMEAAAGEALAVVDEVLASATPLSPVDTEFYLSLELPLDRIAATRSIEALTKGVKK